MRSTAAIFLFCLFVVTTAPACARTATAAERAACEAKVRPELDRIEERMRRGYRAAEGEALRQRLRELKDQIARCRTTQ